MKLIFKQCIIWPYLVKLIFGVTITWIKNDCHLEFKMVTNGAQTRMRHLYFLDLESLHILNLKPNWVDVDVHTGNNTVFLYISIRFESYDVMISIIVSFRIVSFRIRFWIYPFNHKSIGHQTQPTNKWSNHGWFFFRNIFDSLGDWVLIPGPLKFINLTNYGS